MMESVGTSPHRVNLLYSNSLQVQLQRRMMTIKWSPLVWACYCGHKDVALHLLEHGEPLHLFSCWDAVLIVVHVPSVTVALERVPHKQHMKELWNWIKDQP